tara:strand:- start:156 stop:590 length:435 start_codon:yes stop_codon:yes gene_type:complete
VSNDGTQNFNLHEKFKSKNALIICVPGAFTSTCHNQHLPPFIEGSESLMSNKELDYLCCITTNDPYVLDLWRKSLGNSKIIFLSDGNSEFLNSTKLIRFHEKSFMGNRFKRSIIISKDLKVTDIICDNPSELDKTSFDSVLKTI